MTAIDVVVPVVARLLSARSGGGCALSTASAPEHRAVPQPPLRERPGVGGVRLLARSVAVLVGAVLALALAATPALAHADLVRSDPANGSTVGQSPSVVHLWFSEEVSDHVSTARLVRGDGSPVAGTAVLVPDSDQPELELRVPRLPTGTYGVLWRVLATDDGHTTSGTLVFSVGSPSAAAGLDAGTADTPQGAAVVLRWARVVLLAGLVGAVTLIVVVLGPVGRRATDPRLTATVRSSQVRLQTLGVGCAGIAAVVALADLVHQSRRLGADGTSWASTMTDLLTRTRWGQLWVVHETLLVLVVVLLVGLRRRADGTTSAVRARTVALCAATVGLAWVEAAGSHAASVESARAVAVLADTVHVLAGCLWLGVLPALVVVLWPSAGGAGERLDLLKACARPLGVLVASSVAVVVVTGLYGAGRQVDTVEELTTTSYGRALLVKTALLAGLLAVGAVSAARVHASRRPLTIRLLTLEAGVGVVLLVAVALLAETPPPRDQTGAPVVEAVSRSGQVDDLVVSVSVSPDLPGPNGFAAVVASSRRPAPAAVDSVTLLVGPAGPAPTTVQLRPTGADRWFGTSVLGTAGPVQVEVVVVRAGHRLTVPLAWDVDATTPAGTVARTGHELAPIADGIAVALVVAVLVAVTVARRRRRSGLPSLTTDDEVLVSP